MESALTGAEDEESDGGRRQIAFGRQLSGGQGDGERRLAPAAATHTRRDEVRAQPSNAGLAGNTVVMLENAKKGDLSPTLKQIRKDGGGSKRKRPGPIGYQEQQDVFCSGWVTKHLRNISTSTYCVLNI